MKWFCAVIVFLTVWFGSVSAGAEANIRYRIDATSRKEHRLHVSVSFAPGHEEALFRLPTWYALYQIRDFSRYVEHPAAFSVSGQPLPVRVLDKTTWGVPAATPASRFEYDVHCNIEGPYGLEISADRLLINPALLLVFSPHIADGPAEISFRGLSADWKIFSPLKARAGVYQTDNYEQLTDSPFWLGHFVQEQYMVDGTQISIVVDARRSDFNLRELVGRNRKIVMAEKDWMKGLPISSYVFLYQFSARNVVEGMEHTQATAISLPASSTRDSMSSIDTVTAHEFFHLWNVMRLRPCSLEPVDFTHEQYSRALWFSEGLTSAVSRSILLGAGMMKEEEYLARLGDSIDELQKTSARKWQSLEDASMSVWLSGNETYDAPERSVSYYRKGELLGVLLDLMIRRETKGSKSLRDVFLLMEEHYGREHRCFDDSKSVQEAVESVTGQSAPQFFKDYVAGVKELPYDEYLRYVGLRLTEVPAAGQHGQKRHVVVSDLASITMEELRNRRNWLRSGR